MLQHHLVYWQYDWMGKMHTSGSTIFEDKGAFEGLDLLIARPWIRIHIQRLAATSAPEEANIIREATGVEF